MAESIAISKPKGHIGIASAARSGETVCGDRCAVFEAGTRIVFAIADGLGFGAPAASAALQALEFIESKFTLPLSDLFTACDLALHGTRGVALGVFVLQPTSCDIEYLAVGSIHCWIHTAEKYIFLPASWGIVGHGCKTLYTHRIKLHKPGSIILFTDGIESDFDPDILRDRTDLVAEELAGLLVRSYRKPIDDAAVLLFQGEVG